MGRLRRRRTTCAIPYSARNSLFADAASQCSSCICVGGGKPVAPDKMHLLLAPYGGRSPGAGGRKFVGTPPVVRRRLLPPCLLVEE